MKKVFAFFLLLAAFISLIAEPTTEHSFLFFIIWKGASFVAAFIGANELGILDIHTKP